MGAKHSVWCKTLALYCHIKSSQATAGYFKTKPKKAELLHENLHIDDCFFIFGTINEARDSTTQLKPSSTKQGDSEISSSYLTPTNVIYSNDGGENSTDDLVHRVLGFSWDTTDDLIFVQRTTKVTTNGIFSSWTGFDSFCSAQSERSFLDVFSC